MEFIYRIFDYDKELFLYLNSKHITWLDPIMLGLSSFTSWILVCLAIIALMIYRGGRWRFIAPVFMLLNVGMNAAVNNIVKWIVERPRPLHVELWQDTIHVIEKYEESFSFFSGHSSNSFTMVVFASLYFRNKTFSILTVAWALAVAYSRIYVGKHYPIDIICGIFVGIFMGYFGTKIFEVFKKKKLEPKL